MWGAGRHDLYTPIFRCKCGYVDEELGKAMHQSGFYSTGRNSSTFYSINLLDSWHFLKRSSPGTSLQALVSALELFGASRGRVSFHTITVLIVQVLNWCINLKTKFVTKQMHCHYLRNRVKYY